MLRKAQGLPLNVIIIAVLGLIVLVILVVLVQRQVTKTSTGLKEVSENVCGPPAKLEKKPIGTEDCEVVYGSFKNLEPGEICCKKK